MEAVCSCILIILRKAVIVIQALERASYASVFCYIFSLIERICDRVGIIINGTMIECGTLAEICAGKSLEDRFFGLYQDHVGREETNISGKERA